MIVPLPIFVTDPADARASRVALLGELRTAAEHAAQRVRAAGAAATRAVGVTDNAKEMDELADAVEQLMGRYCEAGVDRGALLEHARMTDGHRDDVWLANALVELRHRYQRLTIDAQGLIDTAEIYATPPPPAVPAPPMPPPAEPSVDPFPFPAVPAAAREPLRVL